MTDAAYYLTFMGPCILNAFLSTTNNMLRYTLFFIVVSADNKEYCIRCILLVVLKNVANSVHDIPYILESNPHPFYSFRGLKNQMWIRIACGLDSLSRAGFWKNNRAAVRAVRIIQ